MKRSLLLVLLLVTVFLVPSASSEEDGLFIPYRGQNQQSQGECIHSTSLEFLTNDSSEDDYDIPNLFSYTDGYDVWCAERNDHISNPGRTKNYDAVTYDCEDTYASFVDDFLVALETDYDFELVDVTGKGQRWEHYFFYYNGFSSVSPINSCGDSKETYHLEVMVSRGDHLNVALHFYNGLNYGGWDEAIPGQGHVVPDSVPDPIPNHGPLPQPCPKCHGNKTVRCSQCDGQGGKYIYDNSTNSTGRTWENCRKCGGTGEVDCTYCGGDGKIND